MKKIFAFAPVALIMAVATNAQAATQGDVTLMGTIVDTTCEVTANNGAATLNVGSFGKSDFTAAKKQVGNEPLLVTLANCSADEEGFLSVTGVVGADTNVFVSDTTQPAGFMLQEEGSTTQVVNGDKIAVTAGTDGSLSYTFNAGMAVFDAVDAPVGEFYAPIKISYVNN